MSILSSAKRQERQSVSKHKVSAMAEQPVVLGGGSLYILAVARIILGYLWFQQLFWKLPPSFAGLHKYVVEEGKYTFLPGYSFIIQHVFLPNFTLLGAGTFLAELLVGISLMFGIFSRLGALLSFVLAAQLYVGLAYASGEWYWTYGMLVLLGVVFVAVPAGRRLGVDQWFVGRFENAKDTRLMRLVRLCV